MAGSGDKNLLFNTEGGGEEVKAAARDEYQSAFGSETLRKRHKHITAHPSCDCEFHYRDYSWKRFSEYEPSRDGVNIREVYVVNLSGKEVFTYAEGAIGGVGVETRFPFLCGEIVSSKKLASAGKLKNLYAWVQSQPNEVTLSSVSAYDMEEDDRPLHVLQRQEDSAGRSLTSLPLALEKQSKVVVFRTHGSSLFVQLMPTIRSERKLISGTPLFDRYNRGIRAAVGSMFSQHEYVVNCVPTEFCEIPILKNKQGSDRLVIICLDRRGLGVNDFLSEKKQRSPSVLSFIGSGLGTIIGTSLGANSPATTTESTNTQSSGTSVGDSHSLSSNELDTSSENEIVYKGVVNDRLQITDSFVKDKKNKPPKYIVTIVIDDDGVSVQYEDGRGSLLFTWVHKDPKISYGIMPRRFFNAKANVIEINTAARSGKKESVLKRFKSLERLI